jgi:poly(3-hydroxyalkanoate) synthetase
MVLRMATDALAPTNALIGNPAALKRIGGLNLIKGIQHMAADWRDNGGLPGVGTARGHAGQRTRQRCPWHDD